MDSSKVCRICLNTNVKMYRNSRLDSYYKEFINYDDVDIFSLLPKSICYECSALLIKSLSFQHKCRRSFHLLLSCMKKGRIPHENVLLLDRSKHNLKSNLRYMESNSRVQIILEKKDCDEESSVKLEPTVSIVNEQSITLNETSFDHNGSLANMNKFDFRYVNSFSSIILEIHDNDLHNELFDTSFNEVLEKPQAIVAEPLAPIQTDNDKQTNTQEGKQKTAKKGVLKKIVRKERPAKLMHNKIRKLNKNVSEDLGVDENFMTSEEGKKTRVRSGNCKMKFDESKWNVLHFTEEDAEKKFQERKEDIFYKAAPQKCFLCLKGFSNEKILNAHKSLHVESRGHLSCRFCKVRFNVLSKLNRHYDSHYYEYHCLQCTFIGRTVLGAKFHEEMHDGTGYTCKTCNENFMHKSSFYTHMRVIHRSSYVCGVCGESYVSSQGLATHKAKAHQIYAPKKTNKPRTTVEKNLDDSTYCTECKLTFETKEAYGMHLLSATNHAVIQDGETSSQLQENKTEEKYVPFKLYRRKRHSRSKKKTKKPVNHSNQGDFPGLVIENARGRNYRVKHGRSTTCRLCGESFTSVMACIAHHKQAHPGVAYYMQKRVVCEVCGTSIQAGNLQIHMNKHTKKIQYPCSVCSKVFYMKPILQRHMLTHTGEKPWACTLCDKSYQQLAGLRLHERTIHQGLKAPPRRRRANNVTVIIVVLMFPLTIEF